MPQLGNFRLGNAKLGGEDPPDTAYRSSTIKVGEIGIMSTNDSDRWLVEDVEIPELTAEERDYEGITLTFRTNKETAKGVLADFSRAAGNFEPLFTSSGDFEVIDRSNGASTISAIPPNNRSAVRDTTVWHVDQYKDKAQDQDGEIFEVTFDLVAHENKAPGDHEGYVNRDGLGYGQTPYGGVDANGDPVTNAEYEGAVGTYTGIDLREWAFIFDRGAFITTRVNTELNEEREKGAKGEKLNLELRPRQTQIVERSARRLDAVDVEQIPDGDNYATDNSPGDTNTVQVFTRGKSEDTRPSFESGEYIVNTYNSRWDNEEYYNVSLDLLKAR